MGRNGKYQFKNKITKQAQKTNKQQTKNKMLKEVTK